MKNIQKLFTFFDYLLNSFSSLFHLLLKVYIEDNDNFLEELANKWKIK